MIHHVDCIDPDLKRLGLRNTELLAHVRIQCPMRWHMHRVARQVALVTRPRILKNGDTDLPSALTIEPGVPAGTICPNPVKVQLEAPVAGLKVKLLPSGVVATAPLVH